MYCEAPVHHVFVITLDVLGQNETNLCYYLIAQISFTLCHLWLGSCDMSHEISCCFWPLQNPWRSHSIFLIVWKRMSIAGSAKNAIQTQTVGHSQNTNPSRQAAGPMWFGTGKCRLNVSFILIRTSIFAGSIFVLSAMFIEVVTESLNSMSQKNAFFPNIFIIHHPIFTTIPSWCPGIILSKAAIIYHQLKYTTSFIKKKFYSRIKKKKSQPAQSKKNTANKRPKIQLTYKPSIETWDNES